MPAALVSHIPVPQEVVGANRALSKFQDNLNWQMAAGEKLHRLELLPSGSADEHRIKSNMLVQW